MNGDNDIDDINDIKDNNNESKKIIQITTNRAKTNRKIIYQKSKQNNLKTIWL